MSKQNQTKTANEAINSSNNRPNLKNQDRKYSNQEDRTPAINKDRSRTTKTK